MHDVIKWKHYPRYWPFVRGIHRSPVNSPHKGQWRGALVFSLICAWINGWVNNREAGDLRRHRAQYDVTVIRDCKEREAMLWCLRPLVCHIIYKILRVDSNYIGTFTLRNWGCHGKDYVVVCCTGGCRHDRLLYGRCIAMFFDLRHCVPVLAINIAKLPMIPCIKMHDQWRD